MVSVGIPYYNAEPYIERSVRSLFSQNLENMEFVFVDDASTDRSTEIIRRVLEEYPHRKDQVHFITHERNRGPMAARLGAMRIFSGRYFIFCDADDYVEPDMYKDMSSEAEVSGADVVHCALTVHHTNNTVREKQESVRTEDFQTYCRMVASLQVTPFVWSHLFRRDRISLEGLYLPENITYAEDLLLVAQLLRQCQSIGFLTQKGYYHYLRRPGSISHTNRRRNMRQCSLVLHYLDRTEKDPLTLEARKTHWRNFACTAIRYNCLTAREKKVLLRYCVPRIFRDRHLKFRKKVRLLYWTAMGFLSK